MGSPTLTPSDLALLRFPGSVPGVLRRGSPVFHIDRTAHVVLKTDGDDIRLPPGWAPAHLITLDLTDATGRAHLAWWLASRQPGARRGRDTHATWGPYCKWQGRSKPCLHTGDGFTLLYDQVVALSLDWADPRLLPDGSRLVDALALSLVARHVAGLDVPHAE